MIYTKTLFAVVCAVSSVTAQIPNFGRCPSYDAMPDFDRENFMGKWYEAERYFAVSELASRCVSVTYERRADGKVYVNNEMTNRFTNVQRIVSGVMNVTAKNDEATFTVKYTTGLPVNYDTTMHVLETDYDSFAVIWSCNPLAGPVGHTESVWVLTRERIPEGPVLQAAYGVLDKFKISRVFFVKTDQTNCETEAEAEEAEDVPESGTYDIVVDDDTVSSELLDNEDHENPQINQVQHIAHVQNLQQFSSYIPVESPHVPQIHHVHGIAYYKQYDQPSEKSVLHITGDGKMKAHDKNAEKKTEAITGNREETKTTVQTKTSEPIKATTVSNVLAVILKDQRATKDEKIQH